MKTKLKDHTRAVIVAIFALTFLGIGCIAAGQQGEEKRGKKQISEDKTLVKESTREGGYQYYFIPLIPIIVVLFGTAGGAFLSYYYWKKKEEYSRKNAILEEKTKSFLNLCSALGEFNAYTDLLMRIDEEKENLTEEQLRLDGGKARFKELSRAEFDYQEKRAEAFSRMRYGINYAKIFFTSDKVVKRIKAYLQLYEKIRTNKIQWGPNAFDQILIKGKELTTSMEEELKERTGL